MTLGFSMLRCSMIALLLAVASTPTRGAEPISAEGEISQVTLYRGQALVTRTIELPDDAQGSLEVIIMNLPAQIIPNSLYSESDEGIEVRAVRYRERAVNEQPHEESQALMVEYINAQRKQRAIEVKMALLADRTNYLNQLAQFVAPTAQAELSQGVLDAEQLEKMVAFSFAQRASIAEETLELEIHRHDVQQEMELIQRKIAELAGSATRTAREAVLYVEKQGEGGNTVRLNYLVGACGWAPTYSIRAESAEETVRVEYNALIQQRSGENWDNIDLVLSTASPALSAATPGLAPFHVALTADTGNRLDDNTLEMRFNSTRGRQETTFGDYQNAQTRVEQLSGNWEVIRSANVIQCLELTNGRAAFVSEPNTAEPTLSYRLENRVSLASRADQQIVRILRTDLPSDLYYVATPVLTTYVHREAELTNESNEDLLGGIISVYLDGRFVGRGEIPTVTRGQRFIVGLGADPQLRSHRELLSREEEVQGGNREWTFRYRIAIENFKGEAVPVRVMDRIPYSRDKDAIQLTLEEMDIALSDNPQYQRTERAKGLLRWDIDVPAESTGEEAMVLEYGYSIEFDRNFVLAEPASDPSQLQREFEDLQQERARF